VDGRDILARLVAIPIESWNYKSQDSSVRHIGPMAQDFHAAFRFGEDQKRIGTMDADGISLAAIQGLYQELKDRDAKIATLETRLTELEQLLKQLAAQQKEH
jgi:trimeric autotransporter adhesin